MDTNYPPEECLEEMEPPTVPNAELDRDPHGIFRRYRLITPVIRRDDDSYIVIRSGEVQWLAGNSSTRQLEDEKLLSLGIHDGALYDIFANTMLLSNGAAHRRRRTPVSRAFAFRLITQLRPRIRAIAYDLIDRSVVRNEMNFLDNYAILIPGRIICEIIGVGAADIPRIMRRSRSLARGVSFSFTAADIHEMEVAARELSDYLRNHLAACRSAPRDDFLTSYMKSMDLDGALSSYEILSQLVTLIIAGSDTTRAGVALTVMLLLQHREQWDAVCRDAALIPDAVSEALRFDPPVGSIPRFTLRNISLNGCLVPAGRVLSLSTMSAMRDSALYSYPDCFNIRRKDHTRQHLVFGCGPHRCLGEALARAELEEGLAALTHRLPKLRLAGEAPVVRGHAPAFAGYLRCVSPGQSSPTRAAECRKTTGLQWVPKTRLATINWCLLTNGAHMQIKAHTRLYGVSLITLIGCLTGAARAADVRPAIEAANAQFVAAFEKGDGAAVAALYASDGQVLPPESDIVRGAEAIRKFWQGAIGSGIAGVSLKTVEIYAHASTATEVGQYELRDKEAKVLDHGKYIVIWRLEGGSWKLFRDMYSSSAPAPKK
jgi:cytochrome P450 family 103